MTWIIAGASSGLGRSLAEEYSSRGEHLVLISNDSRDTEALAAHLRIVNGTGAVALDVDLADDGFSCDRIDEALAGLPPLKGILLPAGLNDEADEVGLSDGKMDMITRVNYVSLCRIVNHYLPEMCRTSGTIVGFGSIATARGRTRNAAYSAAKKALESYFESLKHFAVKNPLKIQFYVLGYLDTNLAFAEDLLFPKASPAVLAKLVYRRGDRSGKYFFPRYWRLVYTMVRWLPWTIFKRLSF